METLTYFSSHSKQVDAATWFLVLSIDEKSISIIDLSRCIDLNLPDGR